MIRLRGSRRIALIAALAAVLVLVGGGGAVAYWNVTAQLGVEAKTATIGMTQTVHADGETTPLNVTYSASNLKAAGAVSVHNTGSREGTYSIVLAPSAATDLPGAIHVAVARVTTADACTPAATLTSPQVGTLAGGGFTATGQVDAGATAILCIQTWMDSGVVATRANQSAALALHSELAYAQSEPWILKGTTVTFEQTVGSSLLFFTDSSARYSIYNDGRCVHTYNSQMLGRSLVTSCSAEEAQWRISAAGDGTFYIARARNNGTAFDAPRWTAVSPGAAAVRLQTAIDNSAQRWRITPVSGDLYRFESVEHAGNCLTVGEGLWDAANLNGERKLSLTTCNGSAGQSFTFQQIGDPIRELQTLSCARNSGVEMRFTTNEGYEQETQYRVYLARDNSSESRVEFVPAGIDGYNAHVQIYEGHANFLNYVQGGQGRLGDTWVFVEQKIADSDWNAVASGKIRITASGTGYLITCGWQ